MKIKFLFPFLFLFFFACSTENEKSDDSILGIWKNTKAYDGNTAGNNPVALTVCENSLRLAFGVDYFYNESSVSADVPCPLTTENTYVWSETATNTFECRRAGDNTLYFTASIENGVMTLFRPDLNRTYQLKHSTN
ncbi:hypothetical protein [Flavobacterium sp.]|uniref:hypothetical protein n=1 Tax=Flavobacterium sp. TaxID=239 RepID=UPI00260E27E2|nr:hypothetical protein [Flavobacterium sp.]